MVSTYPVFNPPWLKKRFGLFFSVLIHLAVLLFAGRHMMVAPQFGADIMAGTVEVALLGPESGGAVRVEDVLPDTPPPVLPEEENIPIQLPKPEEKKPEPEEKKPEPEEKKPPVRQDLPVAATPTAAPVAAPVTPTAAATATASVGTQGKAGEHAEGSRGPGVRPDTMAEPYYLKNPTPYYPESARRKGQEGLALLTVKIDQAGYPREVTLKESSGHEVLDDSAIKTVQKWRFKPARLAGLPVECTVDIPIRFALSN